MSDIDNSRNASSPARSRFNFNNTRFTSAAAVPATPRALPEDERPTRIRTPRLRHQVKDGPLIFNVAQLMRDHEGATRQYDYADSFLHLNDAQGDDIPATDATNITGHVRFTRVLHEVLAQGPGEADTVLNCVRCLNDFDYHVHYQLEDIFRPSIDVITGLPITGEELEDEDDLKIDANHLIDLGEAVRQQILVSLPMHPLCGDACPGLYQYLDQANSDIVEDEQIEDEPAPADPRWAALSKLNFEK